MQDYKIIIAFFILMGLSLSSVAQTQSGEIIYGVKLNQQALEELDSKYQQKQEVNYYGKIIHKLRNGFPVLELQMRFNKRQARLEALKEMDNDNGVHLDLVTKLSNAAGIFYTDLDQRVVIRQKESTSLKKTYRIKQSIDDFNWKITSKKKNIKGYTCYQAVRLIHKSYGDYKTTAWFCPAIPFQYGPIGYCGLPGMILELHYHKYNIFYVKKIHFSDHSKAISAPTKGKMISKSRYDKLLKDNREEQAKRLEEAKLRYRANRP